MATPGELGILALQVERAYRQVQGANPGVEGAHTVTFSQNESHKGAYNTTPTSPARDTRIPSGEITILNLQRHPRRHLGRQRRQLRTALLLRSTSCRGFLRIKTLAITTRRVRMKLLRRTSHQTLHQIIQAPTMPQRTTITPRSRLQLAFTATRRAQHAAQTNTSKYKLVQIRAYG